MTNEEKDHEGCCWGDRIFFILALSGNQLLAQTEAVTLDTVVVTTGRTEEKLREISQNMDVITSEELSRSSSSELVDILKKYGIQINQYQSSGSGQESITIRGFSSSYHGNDINSSVLILIDGRRLVGDSLSMQSLNNIERIEIIKGPGSMQYGSSAMGGVVNIITKRGGENPNLKMDAGFGSWGQQKYSFFGSGQKDKLDMAAGVSYYSINDYKDGYGIKHDNSGLDYRVNSMINPGWNFNDYHRLGLSIQASKNNDGGAEATTTLRYINKKLVSLDLLYEGVSEDGDKSWLARFYSGESSYQLDNTILSSLTRYNNSRSVNDFQGAQGQFSWNFDRLGLMIGADWINYDFSQKQYGANQQLNSTNKSDY